jgi:phosphatidylserine synthase 2
MVIRDTTILWVASISWELVEMLFKHMLPNFNECWWDQWILDVLLCNGLGIYLGSKLCRKLEVMSYDWKGVHEFPTYGGKLKRVAMQFLPESWINVRWRKTASLKRFFGVHFLIVLISLQELNSFFLKTLLWVPASHYLNIVRLAFWFLFSVPCLRQIYLFMADPTVKSIGRQTFLSALILLTELLIIIKFSTGEFVDPMGDNEWILLWVMVTVYVAFSIWGVYYILVEQPDQDPHKAIDDKLNKILVNLSASAEQLQQEAANATAAAVAESVSSSNSEDVVVSPPRRPARKPHSPAVAATVRGRSQSRKTASPIESPTESVVTKRRTASAARKAPAAARATSPARTRKSSRVRKAAP